MSYKPKKQFIFVLSDLVISFFEHDLKNDDRVIIIDSYLKRPNNRFLFTLQRAHTTNKINIRIKLPFRNVWKCSLRMVEWEKNVDYYVVFLGAMIKTVDLEYIKKLRRKYDIKYILLLLDAWDINTSKCAKFFEDHLKFNYIFSFDPRDVKRNGFLYTDMPYSMLSNNICKKVDTDLYFIANNKGRLDQFHILYSYFKIHNVNMQFRILKVSKKEQKYVNEIIYNMTIDYSEVIEGVKQSNCILEVLADFQTGATLRYYEAVCYNKKLLTNNKNVVNLPFYNPEYIHIFEKPEDIDIEWVKERIPIDYGYDGRFSPTHLIDRIIDLEEKKEG